MAADDSVGSGSPWFRPEDLSVVIPTLDSAAWIGATLAAVTRTVPGAPVIVVDDGSTDDTADRAEAWSGAALPDHGSAVRVIRHPARRGQLAATLSGCGAADTPLVFTQDDDILLSRADLATALALWEDDRDVVYLADARSPGDWRRIASASARTAGRVVGVDDAVRGATSTRLFATALFDPGDDRPLDVQLAERAVRIRRIGAALDRVPNSRSRYTLGRLAGVAATYVRSAGRRHR
jgi:glycosyltransferase involved in cell wall biosynthesis